MTTEKICWACGKEAERYEPGIAYCQECRQAHEQRVEYLKKEQRKLKTESMAYKAMQILSADNARTDTVLSYKNSYDKVFEKAMASEHLFDTAEEMVAAICLHHLKVKFQMQAKVGTRRVDIKIPSDRVIVEIDGSAHNGREFKDTVRDCEILKRLGPEWEIVHILNKDLNKSPSNIYNAIKAATQQKRLYKETTGYTIEPTVQRVLEEKQKEKEARIQKNLPKMPKIGSKKWYEAQGQAK